MKKNTFLLVSVLFISAAFAQDKKVMGKVILYYAKKQIVDAKTEIDKLVADPVNANSAEVWAWKSTLDAEMLGSDELKAKCTDCLNSSFEAFKKYEALDKTYAIIAETPFSWKPLGVLYDKFYAMGAAAYKEKNYETAFENFDKSAYFSKIIMKKDIRKNGGALDSLPILMSGYAAQNAQKVKEALEYYSIAADRKFGAADDINMYKYLLFNYSDLKDKANFDKYYAIASEKYPKESLEDYKLDFISKNLSLDEKIAMFDAEDAKGILTANAYMYFGDMFVNLKKNEKEEVEKNAAKRILLHTKGRESFAKAYAQNKDLLAGFNVGVLYYNEYNEFDDARGENVKKMQEINAAKTAEKDPKKKAVADAKTKEQLEPLKKANAEIETKMTASSDNAIDWLEKSFNALKDKADKSKIEKNSYKNTVKFLGILYEHKREKAKGKDPKAYDAFDAKSKLYYDMYDKL